MMTLTITIILIILALTLFVFYVIGLFNAKVSNQVELILFAIANLRPNTNNAKQLPRKLAKLVKILVYKRKLFINKLRTRRMLKKAKQKNRL
jgi:hypothetical protein